MSAGKLPMTYRDPASGIVFEWRDGVGWEPVMLLGAAPANAVNNGAGSSAMVFGLLALVLAWVPLIGLLCALLAIGLGMIGVRNANHGEASNKGAAVAGIVMGCINIGISVAVIVFFAVMMNQAH